jgi:hypothetical protein
MVNKERHSGRSIGCAKEEEESGHCMIGVLIKTPGGISASSYDGQVIRVGEPSCNEVLDGRAG